MNPYLKRLREQYTAIQTSVEGIQTRAVEEKRDLTDDELRSVKEQGVVAEKLFTQIKDLTEIEERHRSVADLRAKITDATSGTGDDQGESKPVDQTRDQKLGGATATARDPGHYRSVKQGGKHSFFSDLYRSREFGDQAAALRLTEHTRALDTVTEGAGVVPPKWLVEEFELLARQGRMLANAVRNLPLGNDPRPMTLPRQTTGADSSNPAKQANENDPVPNADKWASTVDTVTPKPTVGEQDVSRQMLEMSDPAVDALIYGDLLGAFDDQVEAEVCAAVLAAAGAAITTFANEAAFVGTLPATPATDSIVDLGIAVRQARKRPASILTMNTLRWGKFKRLRDSTGRSLIPSSTAGPSNVAGVGSVNADGIIEELPVVVTDGFGVTTYPNSYCALRAADTILFESPMLRFRFEEKKGPETIVLGIWAYTAVIVRQNTKSVRRVQVTAA